MGLGRTGATIRGLARQCCCGIVVKTKPNPRVLWESAGQGHAPAACERVAGYERYFVETCRRPNNGHCGLLGTVGGIRIGKMMSITMAELGGLLWQL